MDAWGISVGVKVGSKVRLLRHPGNQEFKLTVGAVYTVNSINRLIPNVVCAYTFVEIREENRFFSANLFEEVEDESTFRDGPWPAVW